MWTEVAQIVHLTDMHLDVDGQGKMKPPRDRAIRTRVILRLAYTRWTPQRLQELARGLNAHSVPALRALLTTLDTILKAPRAGKLIIVQSGDLEAYGPTRTALSAW